MDCFGFHKFLHLCKRAIKEISEDWRITLIMRIVFLSWVINELRDELQVASWAS